MASIRTLHESGDRHFRVFMQVQYLHGKEWFRERQLMLLASWIMLHERIQDDRQSEKNDDTAAEQAVLQTWLEAIDKLEMDAFVSGYEMGALLKPSTHNQ